MKNIVSQNVLYGKDNIKNTNWWLLLEVKCHMFKKYMTTHVACITLTCDAS